MAKIKMQEALVVEGKYDKNTLSQLVDAPIFVTDGFGIFKNPEQLALLRTVAEARGLIVLTDSDGAGFVIRNHLKGLIAPALLKHAYIPDVYGKEKRKAAPGKEGKLGVEGMDASVLLTALRNAGATFVGAVIGRPEPALRHQASGIRHQGTEDAESHCSGAHQCATEQAPAVGAVIGRLEPYDTITKTDLYELGLTGKPDSRERRLALQKRLGLPEHMSTSALLTALNCLYTKKELEALLWHPESSTWQSPTK